MHHIIYNCAIFLVGIFMLFMLSSCIRESSANQDSLDKKQIKEINGVYYVVKLLPADESMVQIARNFDVVINVGDIVVHVSTLRSNYGSLKGREFIATDRVKIMLKEKFGNLIDCAPIYKGAILESGSATLKGKYYCLPGNLKIKKINIENIVIQINNSPVEMSVQ